jgi:hypothetical protein
VSEIFETDHDRQATEFRDYARVVIAIALEEAAQFVQDECHDYDDAHRIAAAIRAMVPSGNDPAQDDPGSAE